MVHSEETSDRPQPAAPRFGPPTTANPLWRVVVVAGALFCLSCLLWITAGFANQDAPGNRWLNQNGLLLVGATGIVSILSALGAMWTDAVQTQRMRDTQDQSPDPSSRVRTERDYD
jgi:hypothetical protein